MSGLQIVSSATEVLELQEILHVHLRMHAHKQIIFQSVCVQVKMNLTSIAIQKRSDKALSQ